MERDAGGLTTDSLSPDVSVCMPAHRDTASFRRALSSVLDQTHESLEVIVSDDSGGSLQAAVEEAADARIRYFRNPNRLGFARNHTTTMDRATGRFIALLHDDDRWFPRYLANARERFDLDPSLGMVCTTYLLEGADGHLEELADAPPSGRHGGWLPLVLRYHTFIPSSTVLRHEVWEDVRRAWPDVVIGDLVLWIDTAARGWPMYWLDEPGVAYSDHPDQISADEEQFRDACVTVFSEYSFSDPEAEQLRRKRLAHSRIARAGLRLRQRRPQDARLDLAVARRLAPSQQRGRRLLCSMLAAVPSLLPVANAAWRVLRRRGRPMPPPISEANGSLSDRL